MSVIDDDLFKNLWAKVTSGHNNNSNYMYTAELFTETSESIKIHHVVSVSKRSEYDTSISDDLTITCQMYKSEYFKALHTNRRMLTLKLTRQLTNLSGVFIDGVPSTTDTYNAYLINTKSEALETRIGGYTGTYLDDLGDLQDVHIQLVEAGLSEFRLWELSMVYKNVTMQELLQGLMSHPIQALGNTEKTNFDVSVYPPDNTQRYYQRCIPHGVNLADLPGWLQEVWGVYSSGIGYFLTNRHWHIYPLYDVTRYDKELKRITILIAPQNESYGNPNSYNVVGNEVYIVATGQTKHYDSVDRSLDLRGTGFKSSIAGNLVNKFTVSKDGVTQIPKGRNLMRVSFDDRNTKLENIKSSPGKITSNVFKDASTVISHMGNVLTLTWQFSNPYLDIYPGMPCKVIYKFRGIPYSIHGVLTKMFTTTTAPQDSIADKRFSSQSTLILYTEKEYK